MLRFNVAQVRSAFVLRFHDSGLQSRPRKCVRKRRLCVLAVVGEGRECRLAGTEFEVEVIDLDAAGSVGKLEAEPTEVVDPQLGADAARRPGAPLPRG